MGNPFVHVELDTPDAAKAKAFYGLDGEGAALGAQVKREVTTIAK